MPYEKSSSTSPEAQSSFPIQENIRALASLFPSVVRDGQVDVDALRQLCGEAVVKEDELFGLNWRGKAEARRAALTPSLGTLRPCKEESKDWDTTRNLYIEGDNLEVLKLLRKSYGGRVKMIYIDPPYNTGNEFVYPDDYQNGIANYKKLTEQEGKYSANVETSGRYHTDWLNMMYPRLVLARELLSEDGAIFISISDNEIGNLYAFCDSLYGERNRIGTFIWRKKFGGGQANEHFITEHEYIVVYSKSELFTWINSVELRTAEEFNKEDEKGKFKVTKLAKWGNTARREDRPSMYFALTAPDNTEVFPIAPDGNDGRWRVGLERMNELINQELIYWEQRQGKWVAYEKEYFANQVKLIKQRSILYDTATTGDGSNQLTFFFHKKDLFENPKPTELIKVFLKGATRHNDYILDFFSGSATTAHAVMQLNAEDKGNRRFIMVQLPETTVEGSEAYKAGYKNICEIGKERIRRAGEKVKEEAGLDGQNLDVGFRVYKLDSSNVKAWNPQAEDLATAVNNYAEHLVGGRTEEDFLTEIMLKSGIDLVEEVEEREIAGHRVQSLGYGQYYACMAADFAEDAEDVALGIAAWHEEDCAHAGGEQKDTCTVFVADCAFASNDAAKMNFVSILEQHGICNIKAL